MFGIEFKRNKIIIASNWLLFLHYCTKVPLLPSSFIWNQSSMRTSFMALPPPWSQGGPYWRQWHQSFSCWSRGLCTTFYPPHLQASHLRSLVHLPYPWIIAHFEQLRTYFPPPTDPWWYSPAAVWQSMSCWRWTTWWNVGIGLSRCAGVDGCLAWGAWEQKLRGRSTFDYSGRCLDFRGLSHRMNVSISYFHRKLSTIWTL